MDNNTSLTALTLLLGILIFGRSIILRRQTGKQATLLAKQSKSLDEIEARLKEQTGKTELKYNFQQDLQQAEVTTKLQKSRSSLLHRPATINPPERYKYARTMSQSGMSVEEISSALGMSHTEIVQLLKLSSLSENA